jgi:hypothetical protein
MTQNNTMKDSLLWQIRHFVYQHFANTAHPPGVDESALHFNISTEEAGEYYKELNTRHAFFLGPNTLSVRMAWPFSAVPTNFKVHANGNTYYANCAWDMLGIPVVLRSDAVIEAVCTESNETVKLEIRNGQIHAQGDVTAAVLGGGSSLSDMLLVHFPLPFARWYDDLVFT